MTYAIQQISTGKFMPPISPSQRSGATFTKPQDFSRIPRLFTTTTAAKNCLRHWLAGEHHAGYHSGEPWGIPEFSGNKIISQPDRDPTDYTVVEVEVVVKQGQLL